VALTASSVLARYFNSCGLVAYNMAGEDTLHGLCKHVADNIEIPAISIIA
jgi:hypothetical protein